MPTPFPEEPGARGTTVSSRSTAPPPCSESASLPTQDATQHTSCSLLIPGPLKIELVTLPSLH